MVQATTSDLLAVAPLLQCGKEAQHKLLASARAYSIPTRLVHDLPSKCTWPSSLNPPMEAIRTSLPADLPSLRPLD